MTAFYILNSEGKCTSVLTGDVGTLMLNLPIGVSYTLIEPNNMFEQFFDVRSQTWHYPPEEDEYPDNSTNPAEEG